MRIRNATKHLKRSSGAGHNHSPIDNTKQYLLARFAYFSAKHAETGRYLAAIGLTLLGGKIGCLLASFLG